MEGLFHLLIREVPAEGDIVPDGGVEEKHILGDVAHLLLKLLGGVVPGVSAIEPNCSAVVRQPAQNQLQQCGLPAAGGAGDGVFAAFSKGNGQVLQHRFVLIAEADVFHRDGVLDRRGALEDFGPGISGMYLDAVEVGLGEGHFQPLARQ